MPRRHPQHCTPGPCGCCPCPARWLQSVEFLRPLGAGSSILDFEDVLISNNILPLGGLLFLLFCCLRQGWDWDNFLVEADQGVPLRFPRCLRGYLTWVLPCLILLLFAAGYGDKFWKN